MTLKELMEAASRGEITYCGNDNIAHILYAIRLHDNTEDHITLIGDDLTYYTRKELAYPELYTIEHLPEDQHKKWDGRYVGRYEAVQVNHMVNNDPRLKVKYHLDDSEWGYELLWCGHEKHFISGEVRDILIFNQPGDGSDNIVIVDDIYEFKPYEVAKLVPVGIIDEG